MDHLPRLPSPHLTPLQPGKYHRVYDDAGRELPYLKVRYGKRGVPTYYIRAKWEGRLHCRSTRKHTLAGALMAYAQWELNPHEWIDRTSIHDDEKGNSVIPAIKKYLGYLRRQRKVSEGYIKNTRAHLERRFLPMMPRRLAVIRREHVEAFVMSMADQGLASGTIQVALVAAKGFLSWCVDQKLLRESPAARVKGPKASQDVNDRHRIITLEEIKTLVGDIKSERTRLALLIMWATGLRPVELARIRRDRVSLRQGYFFVSPSKNKKGRAIPADAATLTALVRFLELRRESGVPARTPLKEALSWAFKRHPEVEPFPLYTLRHSRISQWVADGHALQDVMNWAGHSSLTITSKYLHPSGRSGTPVSGLKLTDL